MKVNTYLSLNFKKIMTHAPKYPSLKDLHLRNVGKAKILPIFLNNNIIFGSALTLQWVLTSSPAFSSISILSGLPSVEQNLPLLLSYQRPLCHPSVWTPSQELKPQLLPPRGSPKYLSTMADLFLPILQTVTFSGIFPNKIWLNYNLCKINSQPWIYTSTEKMICKSHHNWKSLLLVHSMVWTKLLALTSVTGTKKENITLENSLCELKFPLNFYVTGGNTCVSQGRGVLLAFKTRRFIFVPDCAPHCEMFGILGSNHEGDKDAFKDIARLTTNYTLTLSPVEWEPRI